MIDLQTGQMRVSGGIAITATSSHRGSPLFLCATLRRDADGDPVDCDMVLSFVCGPSRREFEITEIEFDGGAPDDADWPLTLCEIAELGAWFDRHYEDALMLAREQEIDEISCRV
jgi:hypothetical protein